jgi:hypothetical protein
MAFVDAALLVHLAGLLQVTGYLSKNQLVLRLLLLSGTILYIAYYLLAGPSPQWHPIVWSSVFLVTNAAVILSLYRDRRHGGLSEDEAHLSRALNLLNPGQFRRLMSAATWHTAAASVTLTDEGERPRSLFFVLRGEITITKAGRRFAVEPGIFIGEVAWLLHCPATATVELAGGSRYVEWDREDLTTLFARERELKIAFEASLNRDLAAKIGRS